MFTLQNVVETNIFTRLLTDTTHTYNKITKFCKTGLLILLRGVSNFGKI